MTQPVTLVTTREAREYRLLELPPELDEAITKGLDAPLTIHGRLVDDAALATQDATYAVRQMSQTNSLLLCGPAPREGNIELDMHHNATDILELVPMPARLDRLPELLADSEYAGEHADSLLRARKYTPREVRSVVQASAREFDAGLRENHVVLLDGYLRRVSPDFCYDQLRVVVNQLDVLACEPERVPSEPVLRALEHAGARKEVARTLLEWFGTMHDGHVALDTKRIAQFLGVALLRHTRRKPLCEFLEEWRALLGAISADAHVPLLEGYCLLHPPPASFATANVHSPDQEATAASLLASLSIEYVPHTAFSPIAAKRFQELFTLRQQWISEELRPFIAALAVGTVPEKRNAVLEKLLLTHARSMRARWSMVHGAVLIRGAQTAPNAQEECIVYQARVKYS